LSGWQMPLWFWLDPARGELYSWRRELARTAEGMDPLLLTLIGRGWDGGRISWCPLFPNKPYRNCTASHIPEKLGVVAGHRFCLAVENYRGVHDYVSEKILEAMLAGAVPVYLGDENIARLVPEKAFVDVRNFRNHRELLGYLRSCPEAEWGEMYRAGQEFLKTEAARSFSTERFIEEMDGILVKILGLPPVPPTELEEIKKSAAGG